MTRTLPDGWSAVKLEWLLETNGLFDGPFGSQLKTADYTLSGVRVVRLENLANLKFIEEKRTFISAAKYENLRRHTVEEGDLLFGSFVDGATRVALLPRLDSPVIAKADCFCIRPKRDIVHPRFLMFQLGSARIRHSILEQVHGVTRPRVTTSQLRHLEVLWCPLAEQLRIVGEIDSLLTRVYSAQDRIARALFLLQRFRQSVLEAACGGRLTEDFRQTSDATRDGIPARWRWVPLAELVPRGGIFDGPFGSNLKTEDYVASGARVIRLENIGQLQFIESKRTYISEEKYHSLVKHAVNEGDIIFASFVDRELRACVLPPLTTKAIAKADCFCIRPRPELVDPRYLVLQLVSKGSYDALHEGVHGATRPRITIRQLRALTVPICSLSEQREIIRRVEALFALASTIERRVEATFSRTDRLLQAILAKAFSGQLVPTEAELARAEGRGYEPSSDLLEKIRLEQKLSPKPRRGGRAGAREAPGFS